MAFLPRCSSVQEASESFSQHGACLITAEAGLGASKPTLMLLEQWCFEADLYMHDSRHWKAWARSSRHMHPSPDRWQRYYMNDYGNFKYEAWQALSAEVFHAEGLSHLICQCMACETVDVSQWGGDCVKSGCEHGQMMHSDQQDQASPVLAQPPPLWIAASWALGDIGPHNGALYFAGRHAMNDAPFVIPPAIWYPAEIDSALGLASGIVMMKRGDVLLRDPRIWHCGTANSSPEDRFLPGAVFFNKAGDRDRKAPSTCACYAFGARRFPLCSLM